MAPTTSPEVALITGVTSHDGADVSEWLPPAQADCVRRILWAHLPSGARVNLREVLTESDLPFSVDLLDRRDASAEFRSRVGLSGIVELRQLAAEHG